SAVTVGVVVVGDGGDGGGDGPGVRVGDGVGVGEGPGSGPVGSPGGAGLGEVVGGGGGVGGAHTGSRELRTGSLVWLVACSRLPVGRPAITCARSGGRRSLTLSS